MPSYPPRRHLPQPIETSTTRSSASRKDGNAAAERNIPSLKDKTDVSINVSGPRRPLPQLVDMSTFRSKDRKQTRDGKSS